MLFSSQPILNLILFRKIEQQKVAQKSQENQVTELGDVGATSAVLNCARTMLCYGTLRLNLHSFGTPPSLSPTPLQTCPSFILFSSRSSRPCSPTALKNSSRNAKPSRICPLPNQRLSGSNGALLPILAATRATTGVSAIPCKCKSIKCQLN